MTPSPTPGRSDDAGVRLDFICGPCGHPFEVTAGMPVDFPRSSCPLCGSDSTRQTFASYLRNGPLLDPLWGYRGERTNYG